MTKRNLTTTRSQVFGDVPKGTECRICGRPVEDGRAKVCSDYCDNIQTAVMGLLNWTTLRRRIIERDDETCQHCGFDRSYATRARDHIRALVKEAAGERPETPSARGLGAGEYEDFDWDAYHDRMDAWRDRRAEARERYGDPAEVGGARTLEVDHIQPIADGGHPFDPANLHTLCEACHQVKTSRENSERGQTPSRGDLSESLLEYVSDEAETP